VFARRSYEFLYLFRRGVGLSAGQGDSAVDLMNSYAAAHGRAASNALQLQLLEHREMADALAGLAFLRGRPEVDRGDLAVVGHSFGGSLTVLMAEREPELRAAVVFSGAGYSWDQSPELRERLTAAVAKVKAPMMFVDAQNDYSISAGETLAARMQSFGKPALAKIYPPIGRNAEDGHAFVYLGVDRWEPDVFAFLDRHMRR
jgi:dienelactone hydrolase